MSLTSLNNKRPLLAPFNVAVILLVIGAVLRTIYLVQFSKISPLFTLPLGPDVAEYHQRAMELCSGIFTPATPDIHAPFYSYFLGALYWLGGGSVVMVRIVQTILNFLAWGGFYLYWRKRTSSPKWFAEGILAIAMLYPTLWFFAAELVSESLLLVLLLFAVVAFDYGVLTTKKSGLWWLLAGGVATGLAIVTHPMSMIFAGFELLYLLWKRPIWRAVAVGATVCAVVLPVSICRSIEANRLVLVQANSMFNLYLGNNSDSTGGCYLRPGKMWQEFHLATKGVAQERGVTADAIYSERIRDFFMESPLGALKNFALKALLVWSPEELVSGADTPKTLQATWLLRNLRMWIAAVVMILAIYGIVTVALERKKHGYLCQFFLLGTAIYIAQIITVTSGRYRLAMLPFVFAMAVVGGFALLKSRLWPILLGVVVVLGAWWWTPFNSINYYADTEGESLLAQGWYTLGNLPKAEAILSTMDYSQDPDCNANMLGNIYLQNQRLADAEELFEYAATNATYSATGVMNLAIVAVIKGDTLKAEELFKQSLTREQNRSDAAYNYGYFLIQQNRLAEAEQEYLRSLELNPVNRKAINALGILKFTQGHYPEAAEMFRRACILEPDNERLRANLEIVKQKIGRSYENEKSY